MAGPFLKIPSPTPTELSFGLSAGAIPFKQLADWLTKYYPSAALTNEDDVDDLQTGSITFKEIAEALKFSNCLLSSQKTILRFFGIEVAITVPNSKLPSVVPLGPDRGPGEYLPSRIPFTFAGAMTWPELLPEATFDTAIPMVMSRGSKLNFLVGQVFLLLVPVDEFEDVLVDLFSNFPSIQLTPLSSFPEKFAYPLPP